MEFSDLVVSQARAVLIMAAAGILVQSAWQVKCYIGKLFAEICFWPVAALIASSFMYYSTFGKITAYGIAGFFAGLLLWKKICCGIIR